MAACAVAGEERRGDMRDAHDTTAAAGRRRYTAGVRERLLTWFDRHARPLPWRSERPRRPYAVLVAEALLQQTRAERAADAFERFLQRFPDVATLAAASSDEVLERWQGLGYYQRALRLQRAARALVAHHDGLVPDDLEALRALPGVGRYTSHAVAAQAFGHALIAVDANVRRVGARLLGLRQAATPTIEAGLHELLLAPQSSDGDRRGDVAEALIELGALVCTPRAPACGACPLRSACRAAARDDPTAFPSPKPGSPPRREPLRLLVARRGDCVALRRRPEHGRWGGLWGFPHLTDEAPRGRPLAGFVHTLSHRALLVRPLQVRPELAPEDATWLPLTRVAAGGAEHPVAVVDQRLARQLLRADAQRRHGGARCQNGDEA